MCVYIYTCICTYIIHKEPKTKNHHQEKKHSLLPTWKLFSGSASKCHSPAIESRCTVRWRTQRGFGGMA